MRLLLRYDGNFWLLYVFVVIEHSRRRLAHVNLTANPTAEWTLQQLREVVGEGARIGIWSMTETSPAQIIQ